MDSSSLDRHLTSVISLKVRKSRSHIRFDVTLTVTQPIPLDFKAMFHQYFEMGHRIKHYLSPRVLLCLVTGKFVPPINRKSLYSLQYSMLPSHRAGIFEMWDAVNSLAPTRQEVKIAMPVLANG